MYDISKSRAKVSFSLIPVFKMFPIEIRYLKKPQVVFILEFTSQGICGPCSLGLFSKLRFKVQAIHYKHFNVRIVKIGSEVFCQFGSFFGTLFLSNAVPSQMVDDFNELCTKGRM